MGLGKTLSIISLIMTNFHDKRPLARPQHGFQRRLSKEVRKFFPSQTGCDLDVKKGKVFWLNILLIKKDVF